MKSLVKELYRSSWQIEEEWYGNGQLWYHIYRLPGRQFMGREHTARRCRWTVDQILLNEKYLAGAGGVE